MKLKSEKDDSHESSHELVTSYGLFSYLIIEVSLMSKILVKKIRLLRAVFCQGLNLHKEVYNAEPKTVVLLFKVKTLKS